MQGALGHYFANFLDYLETTKATAQACMGYYYGIHRGTDRELLGDCEEIDWGINLLEGKQLAVEDY